MAKKPPRKKKRTIMEDVVDVVSAATDFYTSAGQAVANSVLNTPTNTKKDDQ